MTPLPPETPKPPTPAVPVGIPYGWACANGDTICPVCGARIHEDHDVYGEATTDHYADHYADRHPGQPARLTMQAMADLAGEAYPPAP